jgi:hypothetical protein
VDRSAVVLGRTVHVETGVPSVRFIPLGAAPSDRGTWSAQHAYNALVQDPSKLSPIPATVRPYYGLLHERSASSRALNVRVWAFAVEGHCTDRGAATVFAPATVSSRARCRLWEFVDARTGESVGEVSQEVLPD